MLYNIHSYKEKNNLTKQEEMKMKKLNSVTLEFKNTRTYFQANKVLNIAYNFLDKHLNYTTDTISTDIDNYKITINISSSDSKLLTLNKKNEEENNIELSEANDKMENDSFIKTIKIICIQLDITYINVNCILLY